jgi:hypothetical protein
MGHYALKVIEEDVEKDEQPDSSEYPVLERRK